MTANQMTLREVDSRNFSNNCVSIRCQGYENSLAECIIFDKVENDQSRSWEFATVTCYNESLAPKGERVLIHQHSTMHKFCILTRIKDALT